MRVPKEIEQRLKELEKEIFKTVAQPSQKESKNLFEKIALELFSIHSLHSPIYSRYINLLGVEREEIKEVKQIPHLPITFFKEQKITCFNGEAEALFTSSSTTGEGVAHHYVKSLELYEKSFMTAFKLFIGEPKEIAILALLPSYLERTGSSLVFMVDRLIDHSNSSHSGFHLYDHHSLYKKLKEVKEQGERALLFGVTFALLDFVSNYQLHFPQLTVVETGGMKGRGIELPREEVHKKIGEAFGLERSYAVASKDGEKWPYAVASEYGMAELLSQAWSLSDGIFQTPPWMRVTTRDLHNPLNPIAHGRVGGINIIDLANLYSCPFIETEDMGVTFEDGTFTISGRVANAQLRGCNLLLE